MIDAADIIMGMKSAKQESISRSAKLKMKRPQIEFLGPSCSVNLQQPFNDYGASSSTNHIKSRKIHLDRNTAWYLHSVKLSTSQSINQWIYW